MIKQIILIINILSVYGILLTTILILRNRISKSQAVPLLLFTISLISYLLIDSFEHDLIALLLLSPALLLPYSFWKLAQSIFSDQKLYTKRLILELVFVLAFYHILRLWLDHKEYHVYAELIMSLFSISFLLLSVLKAQQGKKDDLVNSRIRLRRTFIYFVSILGFITILTESRLEAGSLEFSILLQRLSIFFFATFFLIANTKWVHAFFGRSVKTDKAQNHELVTEIQALMLDHKHFQTEGLTIGQLSKQLEQQEYKLRNVINQEMGFRNFPAFINSYRIEEAKTLLQRNHAEAMTIQEIAYKVGFKSIGPFNRAFKSQTGLTPKEFREKGSIQ